MHARTFRRTGEAKPGAVTESDRRRRVAAPRLTKPPRAVSPPRPRTTTQRRVDRTPPVAPGVASFRKPNADLDGKARRTLAPKPTGASRRVGPSP